jgi:GH15 family glucan-1,4-alpha-glucosidase
MHAEICKKGFSPRRGTFMQHYGSADLDASLLLPPLVGFLPANDERMAATITAIEDKLMEGGFVRRHEASWLGKEEGVFLACSCWLADCMAMQGRHDEARALFERVLAVSNDVGLLSEEYHVPSGRLLGNFPQALTHIAVVNTGLGLCGKVMQRAGG